MTIRWRGLHVFDRIQAGFIEGLPQTILGTQYFVSANDGNDNNAGTSPDKPVLTIARARTLSNATIDWGATPKKFNFIWVEPGLYDEYFEGGFYYAWVVGLGVRGTDTMAEIHPSADGGVFRSNATFLGTNFLNMRFENDIVNQPIFDLGILNNSIIRQCGFALGANVAGVKAIDTENCTHLTLEDNDFESGQLQKLDAAVYHRGGADKFAHNCRYRRNNIFAKTVGLYVATNCVASQSIAEENNIYVDGTGKGIDGKGGGADSGSDLIAIRNRIIVAGAGDAIHGLAAGLKLHNETNVNGVFAYETA